MQADLELFEKDLCESNLNFIKLQYEDFTSYIFTFLFDLEKLLSQTLPDAP